MSSTGLINCQKVSEFHNHLLVSSDRNNKQFIEIDNRGVRYVHLFLHMASYYLTIIIINTCVHYTVYWSADSYLSILEIMAAKAIVISDGFICLLCLKY